ncbi:MAG: DNA cytosine methyltransferase [Gammaproteobacteria bacterium]|nr:DNA cytosine methyltransferase [Gammaproteobacteria bacterium]
METDSPRSPALTVVDLFAGAGGSAQGLSQAGFRVLAAVENDSDAAATLRANHPETKVVERDIRFVSPRTLREGLGLARGDLGLLTACPPCQGFSTLGTLDPLDERNDLVGQVWSYAREFQPAAILLENVPGLARDPRCQRLFRQLRAVGYGLRTWVVDAAGLGVPQRRRRLIVLAARGIRRCDLPVDPREILPLDFLLEAPPAEEVISLAGPLERTADPVHRARRVSPKVMERLSAIPVGGSHRDLPDDLRLGCHVRLEQQGKKGATAPYGRIRIGEPAPTMTTRCTTVSCGRFVHPTEHRGISLREAALLQTFPPDYSFAGTYGAVERQIGNAVPVRLAEALGLAVREVLQRVSDTEARLARQRSD